MGKNKLFIIINSLSKNNIEEIKVRITDIVIMMNAIIEENYKNFKAIDAEI